MKIQLLTLDSGELIGEVNRLEEVVQLLTKLDLTPSDICLSVPSDSLWNQLIELCFCANYKRNHQQRIRTRKIKNIFKPLIILNESSR